jgi:hypothetical protein
MIDATTINIPYKTTCLYKALYIQCYFLKIKAFILRINCAKLREVKEKPAAKYNYSAYFSRSMSTNLMYVSLASSLVIPFLLLQASHFALPFRSNIPGLPAFRAKFQYHYENILRERA